MYILSRMAIALAIVLVHTSAAGPIGRMHAADDVGDCRFVFGFATFHDLLPQVVGACLEPEWHDPVSGDGLQRTSGGLLVWRKRDNQTAFTDGYRTWIVGPAGLQERLNTERFPWEAEVVPAGDGYLEGKVTIGPLSPVERPGQPAVVPPEACTARRLAVFGSDGVTPVQTVTISPDCTYRVSLPAGDYVVDLVRLGIDHSGALPARVTVQAGQTIRLDVSIDTGMR